MKEIHYCYYYQRDFVSRCGLKLSIDNFEHSTRQEDVNCKTCIRRERRERIEDMRVERENRG